MLLFGILFLFFFQLLSDFIEAIYAFGLLGTDIPPELGFIILLFSPILLVFRRKPVLGKGLALIASVVLLTRIVEVLLDTRGRMVVSGIGVGAFLIFFPAVLGYLGRVKNNLRIITLGTGLILGVSLSILLKNIGSGVDISTFDWYQITGWVLAVIAALFLYAEFSQQHPRYDPPQAHSTASFGTLTGLSLGIAAVFVMLYFVFVSPNVVARWTEADFTIILFLLVLPFAVITYLLTVRPRWLGRITQPILISWNLLFVLALILTIFPHQLRFPAEPSGYPFYEPLLSNWYYLPLVLMLLLSPVVLIDFMFYSRELATSHPSIRKLGGAFTIASIFSMLIILAHVFTTVYDYIPVIGPYFRDKFWMVHLVVGLVMAFPVLILRRTPSGGPATIPKQVTLTILVIIMVALISAFVVDAKPAPPPEGITGLKVLTYNIQQGYSGDGVKNFSGQLDLIMDIDADIIGLQESDTNRVSGGNTDIVRYFADNLEQYSYYGPKVVPGTFGIALLSKYPIENPRTFYMYSEGEQTATIRAQITFDGVVYNIFVTHLGNGGPIIQQEAILEEVDGYSNVILMGDFNFRPDSEQYQMTTAVLNDAWNIAESSSTDGSDFDLTKRIDHVFLSQGTIANSVLYITKPVSDHPALIVEIEH
jgi:endonuclease/exonuclease/phosphatase family metal-dependent hydrolase